MIWWIIEDDGFEASAWAMDTARYDFSLIWWKEVYWNISIPYTSARIFWCNSYVIPRVFICTPEYYLSTALISTYNPSMKRLRMLFLPYWCSESARKALLPIDFVVIPDCANMWLVSHPRISQSTILQDL
jgi:hypothetical protein